MPYECADVLSYCLLTDRLQKSGDDHLLAIAQATQAQLWAENAMDYNH